MIKAIAIDFNLLIKDYQFDFLNAFLDGLKAEDSALAEVLVEFLDESNRNPEYISNFFLFKRILEKHYQEQEVIDLSARLQKYTLNFISKVFNPDTLSKEVVELINTASRKEYQLALIVEPVINEEAVNHLLSQCGLKPNQFEHITCNLYTHYGKKNKRFFYEILERLVLTAKPTELLYFCSDKATADILQKLSITVFPIGFNGKNNRKGTITDAVSFVDHLPSVATYREYQN